MTRILLWLLNQRQPENSMALQPPQCQRGRTVGDGNFVFLFSVVVEIEWEDLTSGHYSQPSASIRPIFNTRQKKILHHWWPNMFYLRLNGISTKRDWWRGCCLLLCVRTADVPLNTFCPDFFLMAQVWIPAEDASHTLEDFGKTLVKLLKDSSDTLTSKDFDRTF